MSDPPETAACPICGCKGGWHTNPCKPPSTEDSAPAQTGADTRAPGWRMTRTDTGRLVFIAIVFPRSWTMSDAYPIPDARTYDTALDAWDAAHRYIVPRRSWLSRLLS